MALFADVRESNTDSKGISVHELFSQTETLTKVSFWTDQDKAFIAKAKLDGPPIFEWQRGTWKRYLRA